MKEMEFMIQIMSRAKSRAVEFGAQNLHLVQNLPDRDTANIHLF